MAGINRKIKIAIGENRELHQSLQFKNKAYEEKHGNSKIPFQILIFKILTLTLMALSLSIFFSNPFSINLYQAIPSSIIAMGLLSYICLYYFIVRFYRGQVELAILIVVTVYIIGGGEVSKWVLSEADWVPELYWIFGINLQTGCLFLFIARVRWTRCVAALLIIQTFIWFRVLDPLRNQQFLKFSLFTFTVYIIVLPLLSYFGEREDRNLFLEIQTRENHLETFNHLIKEVIPNAVLIYDRRRLTFSNKKIREIFDVETENEVSELLRKIKVNKTIAKRHLHPKMGNLPSHQNF